MRLMIIGNGGSGKSTLAERVGAALLLPNHDLDHLHWHTDGRKRGEAEAMALVADVAAGPAWIIEGVYGWLAEVALVRATALVWLDLPWAECQEGLLRRGLRRGMTPSDQDALLAWARAYWTRTSPSSFTGHERLYNAFGGYKWHLRSRAELLAFSPTLDG
jgi:adenylate kinase family enzyme